MRYTFDAVLAATFSTAIFLGTACTHEPGGASSAGIGSATPTPPKAPDGAISEALRQAICSAEPCGGERAQIGVYRDGQGAVKKLVRMYGGCTHNPAIYFDPDGTRAELIPERPVVRGSEEAAGFQAKADAQLGGLTRSETILCRSAGAPPR